MASRMARYCRRCKNNGILSVLKGHKVSCPFQYCDCHLCEIIQRQNNLMKRPTMVPDSNEDLDVAGRCLGTTQCLSLVHAANGLHQKPQQTKNKPSITRKAGELRLQINLII